MSKFIGLLLTLSILIPTYAFADGCRYSKKAYRSNDIDSCQGYTKKAYREEC
jgi:hypothetical protein